MTFKQFPTLSPITYHHRIGSGRSRPLIVECVDALDETSFCVLKPMAAMQFGKKVVMAEYLGYQLGLALGLPVPPPCLIDVSAEFAESVPDPVVRGILERSVGLNFGSLQKSPGYATYPINKPIASAIFDVAVDAFAFDVLLQNPDRRVDNPNMLVREDEVVLLDLEMAFSFVDDVIARKDPVAALDAAKLQHMRNHAFFLGLKQQKISLNRFVGALGAIPVKDIKTLENLTPRVWRTAEIEPILQYLAHMVVNPYLIEKVVRELLA